MKKEIELLNDQKAQCGCFDKLDKLLQSRCPTCCRIKNSNGEPAVLACQDETEMLCVKHYKQLKRWHDEQVSKGFIKPWTNL